LPMIFGKSKNIKTGEHFLNYVFKVWSHCASQSLPVSLKSQNIWPDHTRLLRQGWAHLRHRH
jgi:hypothetical protein